MSQHLERTNALAQHRARALVARRTSIACCAFIACCALIVLLPARVDALDVGVGTHFAAGKTDEQPFETWSRATQIDSMRDEIFWDQIERERGVLRLDGTALRTANAMRAAHARGMRPLLLLDYGNYLYGSGFPVSKPARGAFARYAAFVAGALADSVEDFEIWNEWNLGAGSEPKVKQGSPEDYVALLAATHAALKHANPRARVIAGAVGDDLDDWSWMRSAIKAGMLKHADAVSIHLYGYMQGKDARGVPEFLHRIESLHALLEHASPAREVPILITEVGWPNHVGAGRVEPLEAAAEVLSFLLALRSMPYVHGVWFYEFRDGGSDAHEVEQNFGFVTHDYQQKPASQALAYAMGLLKAARTERQLETTGFRGSVLRLSDGRMVLAIWRGAGNACKSAAVTVLGLMRQSAPQPLGFVAQGAPRYAAERDAWTIPGELLPQLFSIDPRASIAQLQLRRGCDSTPSSSTCAADSVKCWLGEHAP